MVPASSHAKPEPDPAGTSVAVLWNWSMSTRSWVTNTVEGAAARKIAVVLRSSSVRSFPSSGRGTAGGGATGNDATGGATDGRTAGASGAPRARLGGCPVSRRQATSSKSARAG